MAQSPLDYLFGLEQFGIKFGLDNIRALVDALGHPERSFRVVHVAGTNGKGRSPPWSTRRSRAAGHRTGRYTSPHLVDLAERSSIDGVAGRRAHARAAAAPRAATVVDACATDGRLRRQPTFFEATTAVALRCCSADAGVDVAVCEVGLGGRLDATNVLCPVVTAITSIGHDHSSTSASTLAEIAGEKAGIIKPGVPVVVGALPPEALDVDRSGRARAGAPLRLGARRESRVTDEGPAGGRPSSSARARDVATTATVDARAAGRTRSATRSWRCGCSKRSRQPAFRVASRRRSSRARETCAGRDGSMRAGSPTGASCCWTPHTIRTARRPSPRTCVCTAMSRVPLVFAAMRDKDVDRHACARCASSARALVVTRA